MRTVGFIVVATLLSPAVTTAKTIFVDPDIANCTNSTYSPSRRTCNGGTADSAYRSYRTIQQAVNVLAGGDVIEVRAGATSEVYVESVDLTRIPVNPTKETLIRKYPADPGLAILDGQNRAGLSAALYSGMWGAKDYSVNFLTIEGFVVKNYDGHGFEFDNDGGSADDENASDAVGSHHITIRNCVVYGNTGGGIIVKGGHKNVAGESHDILIQDNVVHHNGLDHGIKLASGNQQGDVNGSHVRAAIVEGNRVFSNLGSGIALSTGSRDVTIRYNEVHDNGWAGIHLNGTRNSRVYSNLIHRNGASANRFGIVVWETASTGIKIYNNTIVVKGGRECRSGSQGWDPCAGISTESSNTIAFVNNIVYMECTDPDCFYVIAPSSGWSGGAIDYNLYFSSTFSGGFLFGYAFRSYAQWRAFGFDADSPGSTDPSFTDVVAGDYRLRLGSIAIDRGLAVPVEKDISGRDRPLGNGYDIGAHEFELPGTLAPPKNLRIVPKRPEW
jgi:parallel beta-helix repeat protein